MITDDVKDVEAEIRALQASRLRRYREAVGLTQREVADRLGVSQPAVARWERENDPPVDVWPRLALMYGIAENYPAAPFSPEKRRAFMGERAVRLQRVGARDAPSRKAAA